MLQPKAHGPEQIIPLTEEPQDDLVSHSSWMPVCVCVCLFTVYYLFINALLCHLPSLLWPEFQNESSSDRNIALGVTAATELLDALRRCQSETS